MEIEWTDTDPETGDRRFVRAEKFARRWHFMVRARRRTGWDRTVVPTRDMWEVLLDAMERRYRRREGITDEDLAVVRKVLAGMKKHESDEGEDSPQSHREHRGKPEME